MSTKASQIRQSKSSNEQSFQALNDSNERVQESKSRPSNQSDFQNINDRKVQEGEASSQQNQRKSNVDKELQNLQKLIINSEKSIQEQFQILKTQYQQREKEISLLSAENGQLKIQLQQLEHNVKFYYQQMERAKMCVQQQHNVSGSIKKAQLSPEKDFSKKSPSKNLTNTEEQLHEKIKEYEFKLNSLQTKLQFFTQQDNKIRSFLTKTLKFNPSFPMQLSTLVQSAVIQLDSNLKQVNRQIENIILSAHLGNANKITARRENQQEERYNHWEVLSNLEVIGEFVKEGYEKGK